jgi:hypothetical protein
MTTMKTLTVLALSAAALAATVAPSNALGRLFPGHRPVVSQQFGGPPKVSGPGWGIPGHFGHPPTKITCFACNLPRPSWPNPGWGHGGGYGHWGHRFWEAPVIVGGGTVAPVVAAAASAPAPAEAAPQAPTGSCNCLTKQTLADGSVLFADVCTQQSAIAPPQAMSAR